MNDIDERRRRLLEAAEQSAARFQPAAALLATDAAAVLADLARFTGDDGREVDVAIVHVAVDPSELVRLRSGYRYSRRDDELAEPHWLVHGEVWDVYVISTSRRIRGSRTYSSGPASFRRRQLAELAQDLVVEEARTARPHCLLPGHGHPLEPVERDGTAVWRCPTATWACEVGSYPRGR